MYRIMIALLILVGAASIPNAHGAAFRIGSSGLSGELLPLWIAQDRALFKKYGLDTEVITIQGGPLAIQALLGGSVQFHAGGTSSPMEARVRGAEVVTIAVFVDTLPYTLVASPAIKSGHQLKGKRFAVSRLGAISDLSLRIALKNLGVNPEKEATILGIGDQTSRFTALKNGTVDATVISPPLTVTARSLGFNLVSSFQDAGIVWAYNSIDTTQRFAQQNRPVVLNFLRGFVEAIAYIRKNKEESIATLSRWMRLNDPEALNETYDYLLKILPEKPYATDKGIQAVLDAIAIRNPAASKFKPQDFYDMGYLRELDASGFLDRVLK
ncbi:MAG TPA: ABC transporter substrate-binding protein [Candidatus Eisenbacteria bacterium]|nr:ABC transporter substrate-binding protein [Candidatus Eisenbacteria bacterium]